MTKKTTMPDYLRITMPDGSKWEVPVMVIAENRARYYAKLEESSVDFSLEQDTIPCFIDDPYQIKDWAANNMNWEDVEQYARKVEDHKEEYQEGWTNGEKELIYL